MQRGYIKLWRKIEDNPLSHDPDFMATWAWILLLANHKKKFWKVGYQNVPIKRGEFITSRANLSKITGVQESKLERILNYLKSEQQIEQQTTTHYRLIIVKNYEIYQGSEQLKNSKRTASEQQVNTTKECKNVRSILYIGEEFLKKYSPNMIKEFRLYWEETDSKGIPLWKKQKTWDTAKRLIRWKMNDDKWAHQKDVKKIPDPQPKTREHTSGLKPLSEILKKK